MRSRSESRRFENYSQLFIVNYILGVRVSLLAPLQYVPLPYCSSRPHPLPDTVSPGSSPFLRARILTRMIHTTGGTRHACTRTHTQQAHARARVHTHTHRGTHTHTHARTGTHAQQQVPTTSSHQCIFGWHLLCRVLKGKPRCACTCIRLHVLLRAHAHAREHVHNQKYRQR